MKINEKQPVKQNHFNSSNRPRIRTVILLTVSIGLIFSFVVTLIILRMAAITTAQGNDAAHQVARVVADLQQACGEGGRIAILEFFLRNIVEHDVLKETRMHRSPVAARDMGKREAAEPPDSVEQEVLVDGKMRRIVNKDAHTVRYVYANLAEESCISRCHESAKQDEVLGVVSVTMDTKTIDSARTQLNWLLVFVAAIAGAAEIIFVVLLLTKENTDRSVRLLRKTREELETKVKERTSELGRMNNLLKRDISKRKLLEQDRKRLERELLCVIERERQRTGRELHDNIGQQLAGVLYMVEVLRGRLSNTSPVDDVSYIDKISTQVNQAIEQMHVLAKGLDPIDLERNGLILELEKLAIHVQSTYGISCTVECGEGFSTGDSSVAINLYRVAQEAITNAIKHAKPKNIKIGLIAEDGHWKLILANDGLEFPEDLTTGDGMGLRIMQHRADMINGSLNIRRRVNGGTIVTCTFPL